MGVEDDCVSPTPKLFVGQIPYGVDREELRPLFECFGHVRRIDMLTPRQLNVGTRSAMIWLETWSQVERILEASCEERFDLGGPKALVVRIADPPKRGENCVGIKPRKLFVGQIPRDVESADVEQLFSRFGEIEELEMPKRFSAVSCAFVRFHKWSQAEAAIRDLNERFMFPDSRRALVVKFADAKPVDAAKGPAPLTGEKRPLTPDDRSGFIKRHVRKNDAIPGPCLDPLDMGYLSSRMGQPMGMGTLSGMGRIEWMEQESQRFVKASDSGELLPLRPSSLQAFSPAHVALTLLSNLKPSLPVLQLSAVQLAAEGTSGLQSTARPVPEVPIGANGKLGKGFSDPRVKEWTLFVGQIPHQANEYTLWDVFRPYGDILELNVLRKDGKHRGCAFVTYETREMSLMAIDELNGTSFPWDGNQRKLVVRFREKNLKK